MGKVSSQSPLKQILNQLEESILFLDGAGRILFGNQAAQSMFGRRVLAGAGAGFLDLFPAKFHQSILQEIGQFSRTDAQKDVPYSTLEVISRRADGSSFACRLKLTASTFERRKAVMATVRDLSFQYKSLDRLTARHQELDVINRAIAITTQKEDLDEIFHDLLMLVLQDLQFEMGMISLFDESRQRFEIKATVGGDHKNCRQANEAVNQLMIERGAPTLFSDMHQDEWQALQETCPVQAGALIPMISGNQMIGVMGVFNSSARSFNEHERKVLTAIGTQAGAGIARLMVTEKLKQSEAQYRNLVENTGEGIVIVSENDTFLFANNAAGEIFGLPADEMLEHDLRDFVDEANWNIISEQNNIRTRGEMSTYELEIIRPDRQRRQIIVTATPRFDAQGQFSGSLGIFRDISDRIRMERALQEREVLLRTLVDNLPFEFWAMDTHGNFIMQNAVSQRFWGDMIGKRIEDLSRLSGETRRFVEGVVTRALAGEVVQQEDRFEYEGDTITVFTVIAPARVDGVIIGVLGIFINVTERQKAEQALRETQERYRRLVESSHDIIYETDEAGRFQYVNPVTENLIGIPNEKLKGRSYLDFIRPDYREKARQFYTQQFVQRRPTTYLELPVQNEQGDQMWIGQNVQLTFAQNKIIGYQAVARDITERKEAEERVRESEEKYRTLVETASDCICIIQDEMLKYTNPQLADMLGYDIEEMFDTEFMHYIHPSEIERMLGLYSRYLSGERELGIFETVFVHKNGSKRNIELNASMLSYLGKPAILVVFRDITTRKRTEEALRESEKRYRLIAENVSDVIWTTDMNLQYNFISPSVKSVFGISVEQMMRSGITEGVPKETLDNVWHVYNEEMQMERKGAADPYRSRTLELEQYNVTGEKFWTEVTVTFLRDPDFIPVGVLGVTRDISERKQAEKRLRDSEERYRQVTENSLDIIWTFDLESMSYSFVSSAAERTLGYRPDEMIGKTIFDLMEEKHAVRVGRAFQEMLERYPQDPHVVVEALHHAKNGGEVWLEIYGTVLKDSEGRVRTLSGVSRDITERIRDKEELQNRLEMLKLLTSISTNFINFEPHEINRGITEALKQIGRLLRVDHCFMFELSPDAKKVLTINEWCATGVPSLADAMRGYSTTEHGWTLEQLFNRQLINIASVANLPENAVGERKLFEAFQRKSVLATPVLYGNELIGLLGFDTYFAERMWSEDLSALVQTIGIIIANALEHKRKEEALRNSEETARSLINATEAIAVMVDTDGIIDTLNEAAATFFRRPPEELIGVDAYSLFTAPTATSRRANNEQVIRSGQPERHEETNGKQWFEIATYPVKDIYGQVQKLTVFAYDITSLKEQQDELRKALRRTQEAELLKTRFLANMSHEIRTPLNHIIGLTSLVLMDPKMPAEERGKYLMIVRRSGENLLEMINTVLDLSKIESGKMNVSQQDFDLIEFLEGVHQKFIPQARAKFLEFNLDIEPEVPRLVIGDSMILEQVLNNLLDNSIKFTNQGSLELSVENEEVNEDKITLHFQVSDTGIGIEMDQFGKIFQSFYQVDGSSTREYRGTGLGLTISQELVHLLGGEIWVESEVNTGSVFHFTCRLRAATAH